MTLNINTSVSLTIRILVDEFRGVQISTLRSLDTNPLPNFQLLGHTKSTMKMIIVEKFLDELWILQDN